MFHERSKEIVEKEQNMKEAIEESNRLRLKIDTLQQQYSEAMVEDREMRTVYDIIRNFFKDSTEKTAGPVEPGSEMYTDTSVLSSIQQSQSDIASLERSMTNRVEHSSITAFHV
jgi:hypothetical protein